MRKLLLIPLLAATLAQAEDINILYMDGTSVTFDVINYISQDFDTAHFSDDWKSGNRYEINVVKHFNEGRIQPSGGTYFFYEQRDWEGGTFSGIK